MVDTNCKNCGKEISVKPYRMKRDVFCSIQCSNTHKAIKFRKPQIAKVCPVCGKTFKTKESRNAKFCSRRCFLFHQANGGRKKFRKSIKIKCPNCDKLFSIPPSRMKYAKNICCSKKCRAELMIGKNNPAFIHGHGRRIPYGKNWTSQRRKAIKRDNWKCQICGKKHKKPRDLGVHHITPAHSFNGNYKKANHLTNLITLCHDCHIKAENSKISLQPKLI